MIPYLITGALIFHQATRIYRIVRNYNAVKHLGLSIVIAPTTWQDPLWMLLSPNFLWLRHLPFCAWVDVSYIGWTYPDKGRVHQKYGPVFVLVSPNRTEFFIKDPSTATELATKWKVWTKEPKLYQIFDVFGKNVNTTNGEHWQRHRKITGGAFRESNYRLVWDEARKQAEQMLQLLVRRGKGSMKDVREDLSLLAMHVLSGAAFGKSYEYGQGLQRLEPGHKLSYFAAMALVVPNLMTTVVFNSLQIPNLLLPDYFKKLKLGVAEFRQYLSDAIAEHRRAGLDDEKHDLVTQLLYANEVAKDEQLKTGGRAAHLTDDELYGNMLMFNVAGFETTATTMTYTIPYLAMNPHLQEWVREEIGWVKEENRYEKYEDGFPSLIRCQALMYETLRLHSVVPLIPRLAPDTPTPLHLPSLNKTYIIPPGSFVSIPIVIMQNDRNFWGDDVLEYNPKRWIRTDEKGQESLISDVDKEGYIPWILGPRVCPGKKFSQVEFVAVVSKLLEATFISPAPVKAGMSESDARRALDKAVKGGTFNLSPRMKDPEKCGVSYSARL